MLGLKLTHFDKRDHGSSLATVFALQDKMSLVYQGEQYGKEKWQDISNNMVR